MLGGAIFAFVIMTLVSLIMIGIGIGCFKSEDPVGFYNVFDPPKPKDVTDAKAWNKEHGKMWIAYGICIDGTFILAWVLEFGAKLEWMLTILPMVGVIAPLFLMVIRHDKLKRKYYTGTDKI